MKIVILCTMIIATGVFAAPEKAQGIKHNSREYREQLLQQIRMRQKKQRARENSELKNLLKAYRQSKNEDEKKENRKKIEKLTQKQFNRRLAATGRQIKSIEKRLRQLKKRYNIRKANAGKIIEKRVEQLTRSPDLNW